jgi:N-acetylated-alpha-linked acidic dipeptidase
MIYFLSSPDLGQRCCRVEGFLPLLGDKATGVSFSSLRATIRGLQEASWKLDDEKTAAEEDFRRFLRIIHFPGRRFLRTIKRRTGVLRIIADKIKHVFGVPPPTDSEHHMLSLRHAESWEEYLEFAANVDEKSLDSLRLASLPFPISKFIKAAKRVVAANRKLIAFERGFISEGGIKDREWYRHLGVAPGKWLGKLDDVPSWGWVVLIIPTGYGATTFPALTEAITYDRNVTLIRHEASRLENLITNLAATISP